MKKNIPDPLVLPLDGEWQFAYQPPATSAPAADLIPSIPPKTSFGTTMPVPAYWDDRLDRVRLLPAWMSAMFNPRTAPIAFPVGQGAPDATLPFLIGTGWYRRSVIAPEDWKDRTVTLHVGAAAQEAWIWLNGVYIGHHYGHTTPFEFALESHLKIAAENELLIAVANTRDDRMGCDIRGHAGRSGGLPRPASLRIGGRTAIRSLFVHPSPGLTKLVWSLDLAGYGGAEPGAWKAAWIVRDPRTGKELGNGIVRGTGAHGRWTTGALEMQPWSDREPWLYEIGVRVEHDGGKDEVVQSFGLRRLERDGMLLQLNGAPIFLRGVCEHHYFPETATAPVSVEFYRHNLRTLKALGFNWLRFHTWVPNEEYMTAADQIGLLIQVEPPLFAEEAEWLDMLRWCRRHPSVVIYCGGNEELLDETKIEFLRRMQAHQRNLAPDALFSPMAALRGVEYGWSPENMGPDSVPGPVSQEQKFNPRRLKLLKEFSDVFASLPCNMDRGWPQSVLTWMNLPRKHDGERAELGALWRWLGDNHPHLVHELCTMGTHLDLDLEHRYEGTRTGTGLYAAARRHLREEGLLERSNRYYRNTSALLAIWRKCQVEQMRRCPQVQGYDLLGASDHHWHRTGYACGMLNEFYEMKPGETRENALRYNSGSVLLLDVGQQRNYFANDPFDLDLLVSLYGPAPVAGARLRWRLQDEGGRIHRRGESEARGIPTGAITSLGRIRFAMPDAGAAHKLTLCAQLAGDSPELENRWDFWVFPKQAPAAILLAADAGAREKLRGRYPDLPPLEQAPEAPLRVISTFDESTESFLQSGGRVVLLWQDPNPEIYQYFWPMLAGRPFGNYGTVIADHPLFDEFPHDGFCDWPFYTMLHHTAPAVLTGLNLPFDPLIESIGSYKRMRKQALIYEYRIGPGRLLGCALNILWEDPATAFLMDRLLEYAAGDRFQPRHAAEATEIRRLVERDSRTIGACATDVALDPNAVLAGRRKILRP